MRKGYEEYSIWFYWKGSVEKITLEAKHQKHLIQLIEHYAQEHYPENTGWNIVPSYLSNQPMWQVDLSSDYEPFKVLKESYTDL